MKNHTLRMLVLVGGLWSTCAYPAAVLFDSGSDGSRGPLNVTTNTTLTLPADGIFKYTTITIGAGATLTFSRNPLNTPVYLLATGDVNINGAIDLGGSSAVIPFVGGLGGPGGFDGGPGGTTFNGSTFPGGPGMGPGGGGPALSADRAAGGSYLTVGVSVFGATTSPTYGTPLLIPLIGGSGGGGASPSSTGLYGGGGGGGGGAILIASNTRITLSSGGSIGSVGGGSDPAFGYAGGGSGGAIRLVAPRVFGNGTLDVNGGYGFDSNGGVGRLRVDSIYKVDPTNSALNLALTYRPTFSTSVGANMMTFLTNNIHLDILSVAGSPVPAGSPLQIQLPLNANTNQVVTVQATGFNALVPIRVALIPASGSTVTFDATINNTGTNPTSTNVNVIFPVNQLVNVQVWTR